MKKKLKLKNLTSQQKANLHDGAVSLAVLTGGYGLFKLAEINVFTKEDHADAALGEEIQPVDLSSSTPIETVMDSGDDYVDLELSIDVVDQDNHETFSDAFSNAREIFGSGHVFSYDGKMYSTNYAEEVESIDPEDLQNGMEDLDAHIAEVDLESFDDVVIDVSEDIDSVDFIDTMVFDEVEDQISEVDLEDLDEADILALEKEDEIVVIDFEAFDSLEFEDSTEVVETSSGDTVGDYDTAAFADTSFDSTEFDSKEFDTVIDQIEEVEGDIGFADGGSDFEDGDFEVESLIPEVESLSDVAQEEAFESVDGFDFDSEIEDDALDLSDAFSDAEFSDDLEVASDEPGFDIARIDTSETEVEIASLESELFEQELHELNLQDERITEELEVLDNDIDDLD